MTVRWIADPADLTALGPAWAALCDRCPASSPFERPEWLLPWLTVFGAEAELRVLTLARAGELAAVIPLLELRAGGERHLGFLGSGVSDYHDAVLPADAADVRADLWEALAQRDWSTCALDRLRTGSPLLGPIPAAARGIVGEPVPQEACPALAAPPGARSLAEILPPGYAYRLGRARRKAEREHRLAVRIPASAADAQRLFDGLVTLHAARWQRRGEPGVLAHESVQRFHRTVIETMWPAGLVRTFGLELDGALAAVVYGFAVHGRMAFYLGAFDPRRAGLSPGALLIAFTIERLAGEGIRLFDFLRGDESYKYRFGAIDQPCFGRTLRRQP